MIARNLIISLGDPSGIGIASNALAFSSAIDFQSEVNIFIFSHPEYYQKLAEQYGWQYDAHVCSYDEAFNFVDTVHGKIFFVIDQNEHKNDAVHPIKQGQPTPECHLLAYESLLQASRFVNALTELGKFAVLVTNPINKSGIIEHVDQKFLDQTSFFLENYKSPTSKAGYMMKGGTVHMTFATSHVRFSEVPAKLSVESIVYQGEVLIDHLKKYEAIAEPVIAVLSLNPHAGESGMLGNEEREIIQPAVDTLLQSNPNILGPLSNDRAFNKKNRALIDGYVCMYHDQGVPVLNILDEYGIVNITTGLNFVRTSAGHGTAYDIAGTDQVNFRPFFQAVTQAMRLGEGRYNAQAVS